LSGHRDGEHRDQVLRVGEGEPDDVDVPALSTVAKLRAVPASVCRPFKVGGPGVPGGPGGSGGVQAQTLREHVPLNSDHRTGNG
jgi:hypothetical protein